MDGNPQFLPPAGEPDKLKRLSIFVELQYGSCIAVGDALHSIQPFTPDSHFLDIGCGTGRLCYAVSGKYSVTSEGLEARPPVLTEGERLGVEIVKLVPGIGVTLWLADFRESAKVAGFTSARATHVWVNLQGTGIEEQVTLICDLLLTYISCLAFAWSEGMGIVTNAFINCHPVHIKPTPQIRQGKTKGIPSRVYRIDQQARTHLLAYLMNPSLAESCYPRVRTSSLGEQYLVMLVHVHFIFSPSTYA